MRPLFHYMQRFTKIRQYFTPRPATHHRAPCFKVKSTHAIASANSTWRGANGLSSSSSLVWFSRVSHGPDSMRNSRCVLLQTFRPDGPRLFSLLYATSSDEIDHRRRE